MSTEKGNLSQEQIDKILQASYLVEIRRNRDKIAIARENIKREIKEIQKKEVKITIHSRN